MTPMVAITATLDLTWRGSSVEELASEHALGRRRDIAEPRIAGHGHAQRAAEGLEDGLRDVVRIAPAQAVDVQRDQGMIDEALEELADEVHVEIRHPRARILDRVLQAGAARAVQHD